MKLAICHIAIAFVIALPISAQVVPQAQTSAGPALTSYAGESILAWAGISSESGDGQVIHKIAYQVYDGAWAGQKFISDYPVNNTIAAPALAFGDYQTLLAWAQDDNLVHYANWITTSQSFSAPVGPICTAAICKTTHAPAMAGNTDSLVAAWTTASGAVQYASYTGSSWTLYTDAVPGVSTKVAPALAIFDNELYLAWVDSDNQVEVEHAALPLSASGASWTSMPTPGVVSSVAPALGGGFIDNVPWKAGNELFLAWTNQSEIDFLYWDGTGWLPWGPPYPIPPGPLDDFSPALTYSAGVGCSALYSFNVAATLGGSDAGKIDFTPVNEVLYTSPFCEHNQ